MIDLAVALGLVLVLEGLLWALAPDLARRMLESMAAMQDRQLATAGWIAVSAGALIVWLARG
ncbi:MAG: DUF2065 domain-containing protein [Hyphomicrobium sp.]|nr:DUF2065 domain-containing protein [Hyphomicrobium sp.]PPC79804.1 MAG: hypothetical protein CTY40_10435 [Hyphomicrobium sp.]